MVKIVFASLLTVAAAGGCSSADQAALADSQTVGEKQDACAKGALSLTKGIDHDKFTSCVQSDLGISASCSECYYATADYGFKNCKAACLLGWCKSGCLSCTKPAQDDLATCAGFATGTAQPCLESTADPSFDQWAAAYGFNSGDDDLKNKYEGNVAEIARLREVHPEAEFAVNQFSGMTFEEFAAQMLTLKQDPLANSDVPLLEGSDLTELATDVDWNVTPVKDQGSCGSCWAFSTIGSIEHGHKLATGQTANLAEQQLVDCDKTSSGCNGGMTYTAMNFLSGKAIYTTSSYPYTARDGTCKTATDSGVRISGYVGLAKNEAALLTGLNTQAVSVIVYADSTFQSYKSGVINAPTTCNLNHGVLATGYTSDSIKIKNSWGSSWGEAGYIRVKRTTAGCGPYGLYYSTNSYPKATTDAVEV